MNYELAKQFVQDASRAHVKDFKLVRMDVDDIYAITSDETRLTVCYGTLFLAVFPSSQASFRYKNDFGYNKRTLDMETYLAGERYGFLEVKHLIFNSSTVELNSALGLVWFVGYRFELEYRFGPDMLEALDFENDIDAVTGWEYNAGAWVHTSGTSDLIIETPKLTEGEMYQVVVTITGTTAGSVTVFLADTEGDTITEDGEYTMNILAGGGDDALSFAPSVDFDGKISVRPIVKERIDAN